MEYKNFQYFGVDGKGKAKEIKCEGANIVLFFTMVFLASFGYMVLTMLWGNNNAPPLIFSWIFILLVFVFLTLVYWYFKTRKIIPLELRRLRILFYSAIVFVSAYTIIGARIYAQSDVIFGSIVLVLFLLYFISKNKIKGYSTRMLMLLSLGLGIIWVHMATVSTYYVIIKSDSWDIRDILSLFFGSVPNVISKFPALILVLVLFSAIISFVPINGSHKNEVLDS